MATVIKNKKLFKKINNPHLGPKEVEMIRAGKNISLSEIVPCLIFLTTLI